MLLKQDNDQWATTSACYEVSNVISGSFRSTELGILRDIIAFVFKLYSLFTHSLAAYPVVNSENGLILRDHSRMGCYLD